MKTITTKYLGPTGSRGSRIKATMMSGETLTIPFSHEHGESGSHARAAVLLARNWGWEGTLVEGITKGGRVFILEGWSKHTI